MVPLYQYLLACQALFSPMKSTRYIEGRRGKFELKARGLAPPQNV